MASLLVAGCGAGVPPVDDGQDAGRLDGGHVDAGADAGANTDAGADAGASADAGADAGTHADAGADAGANGDAGTTDAGPPDSGTDAGSTTDAGPADSGPDAGPAALPASGTWFHDLWPTPTTPPPSATHGSWTAQYQFVADTASDALPDLSASSATLFTFSTSTDPGAPEGVQPRFGVEVFQRNDGCCVTNAPTAIETHPSWAVVKTFTAPQTGWYHLRADAITHFQCNVAADKANWGDGALLEVYAVRSGVTERIWAALLSARNCDPAQISLTEFLHEGDRLALRGVTHSGDSRLDGLNLDPVVFEVQPGGAANSPPCSVTLSASGNSAARTGDLNAAISQAGALVSATCPRAHVVLGPGDYWLSTAIQFGSEIHDVTLRGDLSGTPARLLSTSRTGHALELNGTSNELRGVTFDAATIGGVLQTPFTQGTIEALEHDGTGATTAISVRIDTGFDDTLDDAGHDTLWQTGPSVQGVIFSSTGAAKTYAWFDSAGRTFTHDTGTGRWRLPFAPGATNIVVGDLAAIMARGFGGTLNINGQEDRLTDVTIHSTPELAIRSDFARGLHTRRLHITPGPAVNGVKRLLSSNADGLHLKNLRRGATVEDCDFAGIPEDAINSHADGQWLSSASFGAGRNQDDDWYLVYTASTLAPGNGGALVRPGSNSATALAAFGNRFFNISASGEGTIVRNSRFHELRGNGIVLRGGVALISQNQFWNIFGGANLDGSGAFGRAVNLETQLTSCASEASCGANDEGPYTYAAYLRHNQLLQGDPAGGNTWSTSYTPVIRNQPGAEGCWPWNGAFAALCYPENQDPASSEIVVGPNP
ncbi:MAG: hypothetical protein JST92_22455 [Deltaproteobacteria bacterium]|nr:hypothetical protein [Deltaproteobacteria bacterium]